MSNNEYEKDEFEREIERVEVKVGLSLKGYLPQILPALIVAVYALFVLSKIPINGLSAQYLFKVNILTPMIAIGLISIVGILNKITLGRKNILMVFLTAIGGIIGFVWFKKHDITITYELFQYMLLPFVIAPSALILYYIVFVKTAKITANKRFVEVSKGVFSRTNDSTNLTTLQDEDLQRTTLDLILGLGRIILTVNRNQKILFDKLAIQDAERLHKYLKANSFGQSREYWLTKDRINNRIQSKRPKTMNYLEEGEEGSDDDSFDGTEPDEQQ